MAAAKKPKKAKAVKKVAKKKIVKKAAKKVVKAVTKKAVKKVAKKAAKKAGKKTTKKTAKKTIKKVAKKPTVKKTPAKQKAAAKKTPAKKTPKKKAAPKKSVTKTSKASSFASKRSASMMSSAQLGMVEEPTEYKVPTKSVIGAQDFTPYQIDANEEYMSDAQLEHFRKILLMWKANLMEEVDSTVVHMKEDATAFADPLDRAAQEEGFNLELRTRDRERKLIKKIEQSIDLINTGDYGFCESCGAEIGVRRLEARPTADKCIDCKTFEEIREKQGGY